MLSVAQALKQLLDTAQPVPETEVLELSQAHQRVLAVDVFSTMNVPMQANSSMDGYAVRAADLAALSAELPMRLSLRLPISQRIAAGQVGAPLVPGTCTRIFTGAWLPEGADSVVMQEQVEEQVLLEADSTLSLDTASSESSSTRYAVFSQAVKPGQYVRAAGEDIRANQLLLPAGEMLNPAALALLASVGVGQVSVRRRVRVALFFTGDELVMPGAPLFPGALYNSNAFSLRALLENLGCVIEDFGQVPDDLNATVDTLQRASANNDVVLTCGGVSVGEADYVKAAVEQVGHLALWKIAVKPGKPLAFGAIRREVLKKQEHDSSKKISGLKNELIEVPFVGLPGNPVSAFVTFLLFALPFIRKQQGVRQLEPRAYPVTAGFDWPQPDSRQEYLRVNVDEEGIATLSGFQTSGVMTSLARADGLVEVAPFTPIQHGDKLRFFSFREFL